MPFWTIHSGQAKDLHNMECALLISILLLGSNKISQNPSGKSQLWSPLAMEGASMHKGCHDFMWVCSPAKRFQFNVRLLVSDTLSLSHFIWFNSLNYNYVVLYCVTLHSNNIFSKINSSLDRCHCFVLKFNSHLLTLPLFPSHFWARRAYGPAAPCHGHRLI